MKCLVHWCSRIRSTSLRTRLGSSKLMLNLVSCFNRAERVDPVQDRNRSQTPPAPRAALTALAPNNITSPHIVIPAIPPHYILHIRSVWTSASCAGRLAHHTSISPGVYGQNSMRDSKKCAASAPLSKGTNTNPSLNPRHAGFHYFTSHN